MKRIILIMAVASVFCSCNKEDDTPAPAPTPIVTTTPPGPTIRTTSIEENFNNPPNTDVNVGFGGGIYRIAGVSCGPFQNLNVQLEIGKTYSLSVLVNNVSTFVGDIVIGANDVVTKSNVTVGASISITYQSNCNNQGVASLVIAP